jgi:hypothetical protein
VGRLRASGAGAGAGGALRAGLPGEYRAGAAVTTAAVSRGGPREREPLGGDG